MTGMRLGVGRALLAVVVAELMASEAGLGYLLRESSETWDSPKLFVAVILLVVIGLTNVTLIRRAEERTRAVAPERRVVDGRVNATVHKTFLRLSSVLAGLLGWQYLAVVVLKDGGILASPLEVLDTAYEMTIVTGELYPHVFASSIIFFYGFGLSVIVGVPLGFILASSPLRAGLRQSLDHGAVHRARCRFCSGPAALARHRRRFEGRHRVSRLCLSRADQCSRRHARGQP